MSATVDGLRMQEHWRVFDACRKAVTKEHLSFPVWLQEGVGLDGRLVHWYTGTLVRWYVSDDLYSLRIEGKRERGKEGKWERGNEKD